MDLSRAVEGRARARQARTSPGRGLVAGRGDPYYSAAASATDDDLFQITSNGQSNQNLTSTTVQRERRPRFSLRRDRARLRAHRRHCPRRRSQLATFARPAHPDPGRAAGEASANTPYVVGSEADPVFSPDSKFLLYRRLVATGNGGLGQWVAHDHPHRHRERDSDALLASGGGAYRGAADWNSDGIVFVETVSGSGPQLVFVDATRRSRRVLMTAGAGFDIGFPLAEVGQAKHPLPVFGDLARHRGGGHGERRGQVELARAPSGSGSCG